MKKKYKKKNTEFYLLRKKSLSEADLFVTDYIKTKQRLEILESEFLTLQSFIRNQEIYFNGKKNTNISEIRIEEVHDHEESKHFFRVFFYYESGKIEIMGESNIKPILARNVSKVY